MGKLKKFLFLLIIPFIGLLNVNAEVSVNDVDLTTKGDYYRSVPAGNVTLVLEDENVYTSQIPPKNYLVTFCVSDNAKFSSYYYNGCTGGDCGKGTFSYHLSNYSCQIKESYSVGRVLYIFGQNGLITSVSGSSRTLNNKWVIYQYGVVNWSLISSVFTDDDISIDYSTDGVISSNKEIIDQNKKIIEKNNEIISGQKDTNDKLDEAENTRKGIWGTIKDVLSNIIALPKKIVEFLVDALKSLFIPEDMSFLDDFKESISNKLGFIAQVPIAVIDFGIDLVNLDVEEMTSVTFPTVEIFGVNFWPEMEVDITPIMSKFSSLKYLTDVLCVTMCVSTLNRWREKFTGGGETK